MDATITATAMAMATIIIIITTTITTSSSLWLLHYHYSLYPSIQLFISFHLLKTSLVKSWILRYLNSFFSAKTVF